MPKRRRETSRRRHVAVFVDRSARYGRGLLMGIADYVDSHGPWSLYIEPHASGHFDPAFLRRSKVDGVLAFIERRDVVARIKRFKIPTVEIYGHLPDLDLPVVGNDDVLVGRVAAAHLVERCFVNLGYSGYPDQPWAERRREGFLAASAEAGVQGYYRFYPRSFPNLRCWEQAQRELSEWLVGLPKPLGLMACSDRHAQNVLDACRRAQLSVPEDVALVGSDNDETICRLSNPPLSSVADNPERIGFEAAAMLDRYMAKGPPDSPGPPLLIPPIGVVTRRSTDITLVDDPAIALALSMIRRQAVDGLKIETLVAETGLSRSALFRRFRKTLGRTPHEEILRVKLDRIKELLTQSSMSIERIAFNTGFEHPEYLGVAFKRQTGLTPSQYRAQHRGNG